MSLTRVWAVAVIGLLAAILVVLLLWQRQPDCWFETTNRPRLSGDCRLVNPGAVLDPTVITDRRGEVDHRAAFEAWLFQTTISTVAVIQERQERMGQHRRTLFAME